MRYRRESPHASVHVDMTPMVDVMMRALDFFL